MIRTAVAVTALMILPGFLVAQERGDEREAGATEQRGAHEIVKGNTLWDLAAHFYDDAWRWPVIYEANRDRIEDPHWIYPGQVLRIPNLRTGEVTEVMVVAPDEGDEGDEADRADAPERVAEQVGGDRFGPKPLPYRTSMYPRPREDLVGSMAARANVPIVSPDETYSAPWLEPPGERTSSLGRLVGRAGADGDLSPRSAPRYFDRVRLTFDGAVPPVGTHLQLFREEHDIEAGRVVVPTGVVTILDLDAVGAVALVFRQYAGIEFGDRLRPLPYFDVEPGATLGRVSNGQEVTLLGFAQHRAIQSLEDIVFLDAGSDDGIRLGDQFVVVWSSDAGWSGEIEARVRVVAVDASTSSARIVDLDGPVFAEGLSLRLKGRIQ